MLWASTYHMAGFSDAMELILWKEQLYCIVAISAHNIAPSTNTMYNNIVCNA